MLRDDASSEKGRRLADEAGVFQACEVPRFRGIGLKRMVVQIDVIGHAVNHVDLRMGFGKCDNPRDCAGIIDVVRIQPADDFAVGGADTLVNRVGLSLVLFRDPFDTVTETPKHINSIVSAAAVEHDVFDIGAGLRGDAFKCTLNELPLVVGGCNNADFHDISGNSTMLWPSELVIVHLVSMAESSRWSSPSPASEGTKQGARLMSKYPPPDGSGIETAPPWPRRAVTSPFIWLSCCTSIFTFAIGAQFGRAISR